MNEMALKQMYNDELHYGSRRLADIPEFDMAKGGLKKEHKTL